MPPGTPDELREAIRKLAALGGGADVVRKAAARALAARAPAEATDLLVGVVTLARQGWAPAATVAQAFTRALELEADQIPHLAELRRVAALLEQPLAEGLFAEGVPSREYDLDAAARADARLFTEPLGHLKTRARLTRNPDELSRLAVVSNPNVIREVLRNPRLTEDLVVRIASRRPARPEPLVEIWRSARWSTRPAVRRALVFNPYLPVEVGVRIVPLLGRTDLEVLADDQGVHVAMREQARVLLEASAGG